MNGAIWAMECKEAKEYAVFEVNMTCCQQTPSVPVADTLRHAEHTFYFNIRTERTIITVCCRIEFYTSLPYNFW